MDHIRNARNYREIADAGYRAVGANPLCGDELTVFVVLDDRAHLADVSYQCTCCGITMASASLMTEHVKGRRIDEVMAMARSFRAGAQDALHPEGARDAVVKTVLEIARQHPARRRCAALPWTALGELLEDLPAIGSFDQGRAGGG